MNDFRKFACPRCQGVGKVFECDSWAASGGTCCPPGARRDNCPGQKAVCQSCNGTGLRGYSVPPNQA
ncbi:hypothetical protein [Mesorhizobium sp.]|uniref:hypothetical protein n=1 Tax=Mesorhizobium sp. TaxID=1871066 RepID=UPI0025F8B41E|nr:hypothetical protein [Mesorhizobium sp.]